MSSEERPPVQADYRFTSSACKNAATLIRQGIVIPEWREYEATGPGSIAIVKHGLLEFARAYDGSKIYWDQMPIDPGVAQATVADVLQGWADDHIVSDVLLYELSRNFSPEDVVSNEYSHAKIPYYGIGRMGIDLTDNKTTRGKLAEIFEQSGLDADPETVTFILRRILAAHELGHLIKESIAFAAVTRMIADAGRGNPGWQHAHRMKISVDVTIESDIYLTNALSPDSELIIAGDMELARQTSDERIGRGFELMQLTLDLLRMGVSDQTVDEIVGEYRQYHCRSERDMLVLRDVTEYYGMDIGHLLHYLNRASVVLKENGIPQNVIDTVLGAKARLLGYSNGLSIPDLKNWLRIAEEAYV